jgi:hypothetical protein
MISAALAYHKHVGAGEAKLPRMLIYHAHFDQKALRSNSGFQRRAEMRRAAAWNATEDGSRVPGRIATLLASQVARKP